MSAAVISARRAAKKVELFTVKAWSANAIAFIEERGLTREFSDWCGGWPCPVSPMMVTAAPELLEALEGLLDGMPIPATANEYELIQAGLAPTEARKVHAALTAIAKARGAA